MDEPCQLLEAVRGRKHAGDIRLASDYVGTVWTCLGDERCAASWKDFSDAQLAQAVKDSAQKLVYRNDEMIVVGGVTLKADGGSDTFGNVKSLGTPTPKACMDFECVLTATKKDRDGDVLESKGAQVDPRMPLLWQHIPLQPIGKLIAVLSQDDEQLTTHFAIADTELGRDAAELVAFGALRMSHGFKPLVYAPLKKGKDDDTFEPGYHVTKYLVMEGSLVSVPSNDSAIITAFSRQKLHHPLVKEWAQGISRQRPPVATSGFVAQAGAEQFGCEDAALFASRHAGAAAAPQGAGRCAAPLAKTVADDSTSGGTEIVPANVPPGICKANGCTKKAVQGQEYCAQHLKQQSRQWADANSDLIVPLHILKKLCPSCASKAKAKGYSGIKLGALAQAFKEPNNLAQLCDKLGDEEHPHTACVAMVEGWGEGAPDDPNKFCGWLTSQCGLRSFHADVSWRESIMAVTKAATSPRARNAALIKESHDLFGETHDHADTKEQHKAMCKSGMEHCKAAMGSNSDPDDDDDDDDPEAREEKRAKAGRIMSAEKMERVKGAYAIASAMAEDDDLHRPGQSMMREAKAYLKAVVDSANPEVGPEANPGVSDKPNPGVVEPEKADAVAAKLLGHVWQRAPLDLHILSALEDALPAARRAAEDQLLATAVAGGID